jgi:hypothetical protein
MTRPPYPVSSAFLHDVTTTKLSHDAAEVGRAFARMLKEYEHGTAAITDVHKALSVQAAAALLFDAVLFLNGEERLCSVCKGTRRFVSYTNIDGIPREAVCPMCKPRPEVIRLPPSTKESP